MERKITGMIVYVMIVKLFINVLYLEQHSQIDHKIGTRVEDEFRILTFTFQYLPVVTIRKIKIINNLYL